eukprot:jgi/Astpho2/2773/e_gw1.00050.148.1_t
MGVKPRAAFPSWPVAHWTSSQQGAQQLRPLYPSSRPHLTGQLAVSKLHTLYYEVHGNPKGMPAVVVHGGPGAGCYAKHAQFFDLQYYTVVLVDQRGCGRSTPVGCLQDNTTQALVGDLEKLRKHLKMSSWLMLGGSWGVALTLAYAQKHPDRVLAMVLRGICLMRPSEISWMYRGGVAHLQPSGNFHAGWFDGYLSHLPEGDRTDPVAGYFKLLQSEEAKVREAAAAAWFRYEMSVGARSQNLLVTAEPPPNMSRIAQPLLTCFYSLNNAFLEAEPLLQGMDKIQHIPAIAIHGALDFVCPVKTAYELHRAWPELELRVVPGAGHSQYDPNIQHELLEATDRFRGLAPSKSATMGRKGTVPAIV